MKNQNNKSNKGRQPPKTNLPSTQQVKHSDDKLKKDSTTDPVADTKKTESSNKEHKENEWAFKKNLPAIIIGIITVAGSAFSSYLISRNQFRQIETQFAAINIGKPIIEEITYSKYNLPLYTTNADSMMQYYGYQLDIRHPEYSPTGTQAPYVIGRLGLYDKRMNRAIDLRFTILTINELKLAFKKEAKNFGNWEDYKPILLNTIDVHYKNSASIKLRMNCVKMYAKESISQKDFVLASTQNTSTELALGAPAMTTLYPWTEIGAFVTVPFQLKIEFYYTNEYNNESASSTVIATCDPTTMLFYHIDY